MKKVLLIISSFLFYACYINAQPSFIKDSIDSYINKGMKDWNIPGLAIVIVKDGQVVLYERLWCA